MKNKNTLTYIPLFIILLSLAIFPQILTQSTSATQMSCPEGMVLINQYSCAQDHELAVPSKCALNKECWDGQCIPDGENKDDYCPTMTTCPSSNNTIRCSDNSCVQAVADCPAYAECPSFNPIRCPSGDCRKTLDDCPTSIHCPTETPYLCNDGSCKIQKNNCKAATLGTKCSDASTVRCPDGSCASSKFLCPTLMTCPTGYEKCWDGNCVPHGDCDQLSSGQDPLCYTTGQLLCQFDFSCVENIKYCATGIVCPVDKPVRCWDNSCREQAANCPEFQNCPSGLTPCPDGSCGLGSCGTHITCSDEAPFRCFDNTCRQNPEDCPSQPSCSSETPILCWDGRCLAERGECLSPSTCDAIYPVKCPNGLCSKDQASCKAEEDCPSEFVKCSDGTCRKKLAYCPEEACAVNLPYKCKNGLCVSDEKYCDKDNGCPFNLPQKCSNGTCVSEDAKCETYKCPTGKKLCPDGSCLDKKVVCPSINGCPSDTPFRCADGSCVNLKKTSCTIPICDATIPIKCFDGTCVETSSYCPTERKTSESGLVICANGQEANSYDECKPLSVCEEGEVRCGDGTCRSKSDECPPANTCPDGQVRCERGSCADNAESCPEKNGCPASMPKKCEKSGYCIKTSQTCEDVEKDFTESNGCSGSTPYKCTRTNKCVATSSECTIETGCKTGELMCDDGTCTKNFMQCGDSEVCGTSVPEACPYPFDIVCSATVDTCVNYVNCPLNAPNRCTNGECKKYPYKRYQGDTDGCEVGVACPSYKPYVCADGSCVEKSSFCKSFSSCDDTTPYLCFDRTCAATKDECDKQEHQKCPAKNPVLCPNGKCVSSIFDCSYDTCPYWYPIHCVSGKCTTKPSECSKLKYDYEQEKYIDYNLCEAGESVCYDASCRTKFNDCPIYPGCGSTEEPYKCLDGGCAVAKENCTDGNNPESFTCAEGKTLCMDGICRENCTEVEYYGCPNDQPLLCPNGRCVSLLQECVGESGCDSTDYPFRCIDGTCVSAISECKSAFREFGTTNVSISIFPQMEIDADLIIGKDNALIGSIQVPSDSITIVGTSSDEKKQGATTQISLRSVPRSEISDTYTYYNKTRMDDLKSVYPYADEGNNMTLTYEYAVLSPAVKLTLRDPKTTEISGKILLTLLFDFPHNHENINKSKTVYEEDDTMKRYTTLQLDYLKDACLAILDEEKRLWNCTGYNVNVEDLNNLQLTGELNKEGIYAVILSTRPNTHLLYITPNWLLAHLKEVTTAILILLFLIGFGFYIFIRIYRYRLKYKGTKEVYKGFEVELSELQDKSVTGRQGQTYGDVKEGIIYTDNIAFKSQIDSDARKKNTQLEKLFDAFTKRLRLLERNNALLKSQYESMKTEYNRLNDYKNSLQNNPDSAINANVNVSVNLGGEMKPMGDQSVGAINDPDAE